MLGAGTSAEGTKGSGGCAAEVSHDEKELPSSHIACVAREKAADTQTRSVCVSLYL